MNNEPNLEYIEADSMAELGEKLFIELRTKTLCDFGKKEDKVYAWVGGSNSANGLSDEVQIKLDNLGLDPDFYPHK